MALADVSEKQKLFRTAVNHNKATGFERRLELYLMENFKHAFDMERFGIQFRSRWNVLSTQQLCLLHPNHAGGGPCGCISLVAKELEGAW
jgi:hypothetical protein